MKIIFVDGYNVINTWPNIKNVKNYSFESARKLLVDTLQNYASFNECKIFLIFDAYKKSERGMRTKDTVGNITVIFTKAGQTADSYIENAIDKIGREYDVSVVTSDNLEQQVTFQRGAVRISSLEFYYDVMKTQKTIINNSEKSHSKKRNLIEDIIDQDVLEKLEKIRKGH